MTSGKCNPYCQYASGQCDQSLSEVIVSKGFFAYPSQPSHIARTVSAAVEHLQHHSSKAHWISWDVSGRVKYGQGSAGQKRPVIEHLIYFTQRLLGKSLFLTFPPSSSQ